MARKLFTHDLAHEILSYGLLSEPKVALDGGSDGLDIARMLTRLAPARLKDGGALILELGGGQPKTLLEEMPDKLWKEKKMFRDICGIERFLFARKN